MIDTGLLIGMAQIAVTIAGFAAVASSLSARAGEGKMDAARLVIMLIYSLYALVASLAPIALSLFGIVDEWVWRGSAIFMLTLTVIASPAQVRRTARARAIGLPLYTIMSSVSLFLLGIASWVLCAFNIPAGRLEATYFVGLYIGVVLATILLFRIAFSMLNAAKPDQPPSDQRPAS
jgi:hypothetical protein